MEPKANFLALGVLVVVALGLAFGAVYWLLRYNVDGQTREIAITIPGSANGLAEGSPVLFNGLRVGKVVDLALDTDRPDLVRATAQVNLQTPIRSDTKVELATQVLSGLSSISLSGGSPDKPSLLTGDAPVELVTKTTGIEEAISAASETLIIAKEVLVEVKTLVSENKQTIDKSVADVAKFTDALAQNAEGVDSFLKNVTSAAQSLDGLSTKLDAMSDDVSVLVKAVDPVKISKTLENVEAITADMRATTGRIDQVFNNVDGVVKEFGSFSSGLNSTLANVNGVVTQIGGANLDKTVGDIGSAAAKLNETLAKFDGLVDAVQPDDIRKAITDVTAFTQGLDKIGLQIDAMIASGQAASVDVRNFTQNLSGQTESIEKIVQNAATISEKLITTSDAINGLVGKVGGLVDQDGDSLIEEATAAARSINRIAATFEARANAISGGLERFSTRGLKDIEILIAESRRAVTRVEATVSQFESNPSRFLFGKSNVPEYSGRQRR